MPNRPLSQGFTRPILWKPAIQNNQIYLFNALTSSWQRRSYIKRWRELAIAITISYVIDSVLIAWNSKKRYPYG
jgi:hypothetical protein